MRLQTSILNSGTSIFENKNFGKKKFWEFFFSYNVLICMEFFFTKIRPHQNSCNIFLHTFPKILGKKEKKLPKKNVVQLFSTTFQSIIFWFWPLLERGEGGGGRDALWDRTLMSLRFV